MAVALPSDLIVDVMRNADPERLNTATAKLRSLEAPQRRVSFENVVDRMDPSLVESSAQPGSSPAAYVEFERMVLRNLFESLLPVTESGAFGSGPSAGVWRSLAADQFAGLYAETGGVGIAVTLAGDDGAGGGAELPRWPYFSSDRIEAFAG